jgi:SulP family sulfate permease
MKLESITRNSLAGITTSLAMVPEVVAFAILAHVNPLVGLYAAVILGLVTALFGGRPGLISGGAGSLAVVSVALVITHGVEYLFACIVLMGVIQIIFGVFKLSKLIKLVSASVMTGFVNGLALVIFLAQLNQFEGLQGYALVSMGLLIVVTIIGVLVAPMITKHIPSSLFGIVLTTMVVMMLGIDTKTVGDIAHISGALPSFHIPEVPMTLETLWIVLPYSLILAAVGLIETLLTTNLVDDYVHEHKTDYKTQPNRESIAQGAGNVLTGLFGGMGGCAMIGQTVINLDAGGFNRLAGVVQALSILAYIGFASVLIEAIPLAALVGVMCVVCYNTFDWNSFKVAGKPKQDIVIMLIVTISTVVFNLAYAVILGVLLTTMLTYIKLQHEA